MIGYVFDEKWASANQDAIARFIAMTRKAKEILSTSDAEWETIAPLTGAADAATLRTYRDRYREGIPRRPIADEEADAAFSTACWPRSAAENWSVRRRNSNPVRSITRSPEIEVPRLLSFAVFVATWWIASLLIGDAKLPPPPTVLAAMTTEAKSGALFFNLGVTLARVALAFVLAMSLGSAIGYLMGRVRLADRFAIPG